MIKINTYTQDACTTSGFPQCSHTVLYVESHICRNARGAQAFKQSQHCSMLLQVSGVFSASQCSRSIGLLAEKQLMILIIMLLLMGLATAIGHFVAWGICEENDEMVLHQGLERGTTGACLWNIQG